MPSREYQMMYIDDDPRDLEKYSRALESHESVGVDQRRPSASIDPSLFSDFKGALVLVDYLLELRQGNQRPASYKGTSLIAVAREQLPNTPLVLISRRSIMEGKQAPPRELSAAYDELLLKEDLDQDHRRITSELIELVRGFRKLKEVKKKTWAQLARILEADKSEETDLAEANPPARSSPEWRVPEAARWIREVLLKYPGILVDSLHAATVLGVEESAFMWNSVQKYFQDCLYVGPFASEQAPHWWKKRLLMKAGSIVDEAKKKDSALDNFADAWKKLEHKNRRLPFSKCVVSGLEPADCVCYVLKKPVLRQNSLPYLPDDRPAVMDEARLSFKAIRETNDYNERLIRRDAQWLLKRVQKGEL